RSNATPTAALRAGHASTCASASTPRDTTAAMESIRVEAVSPFAAAVGYSRAVRRGSHVAVAGTAPIVAEGQGLPSDAYGQAVRCLEIVLSSLRELGAGP